MKKLLSFALFGLNDPTWQFGLLFIAVFIVLILKRNSKFSTIAGILCLLVSIPLFATWIFFTAQHLVYYAFAFFILSVILLIKNK